MLARIMARIIQPRIYQQLGRHHEIVLRWTELLPPKVLGMVRRL